MAWGPFIALILKALPDLLFLWRRRVENGEQEKLHDDVQEFRAALFNFTSPPDPFSISQRGGEPRATRSADLDRAAVLLEQRVREARYLRQQRS